MDSKCEKTGKVQYRTRAEAGLALEKVKVRRKGHRTEQSIYRCQHCNRWHLTKMGGKTRPRMAPATKWKWTGGSV